MSSNHLRKLFLGFVSYKPRWGLTWRGRGVIILAITILGFVFVWRIHPFLATSNPVETNVMVVEGWISMPSIQVAVEMFEIDDYEMIYTVGGSILAPGTESKRNYAEVTAGQFLELGIPADRVEAVFAGEAQRDRTYTSAVALREWFESAGPSVHAFNIVTEGPHSRRSRLMFEAAFPDQVSIGAISIPDYKYDSSRWWRYSEGVKEVISEGAAYLYSRLLFRADDP